MAHPTRSLLFTFLLAFAPFAHAASGPTQGPIARYHTEGKFENVREDIKLAIQNQGLVIDHTSHIHNMLVRTGKDLGTTKEIFSQGEAFVFCSASVSRQTMEADAHNIAYCPYVITVYALPKEPKRVYVAYRRPDTKNPAMRKVEDLLQKIVKEALGMK